MNPQAAWNDLRSALATGAIAEAFDRAESLAYWFEKDGYRPHSLNSLVRPAEAFHGLCRVLREAFPNETA